MPTAELTSPGINASNDADATAAPAFNLNAASLPDNDDMLLQDADFAMPMDAPNPPTDPADPTADAPAQPPAPSGAAANTNPAAAPFANAHDNAAAITTPLTQPAAANNDIMDLSATISDQAATNKALETANSALHERATDQDRRMDVLESLLQELQSSNLQPPRPLPITQPVAAPVPTSTHPASNPPNPAGPTNPAWNYAEAVKSITTAPPPSRSSLPAWGASTPDVKDNITLGVYVRLSVTEVSIASVPSQHRPQKGITDTFLKLPPPRLLSALRPLATSASKLTRPPSYGPSPSTLATSGTSPLLP